MTTRRPIRYTPTLDHIAQYLDAHRSEIELGWSVLRSDLNDLAGWPARKPEGDRKPRTIAPDPEEHGTISYNDPTGEQHAHLARMHDDRDNLEDMRRQVEHLLRQMARVANRYRPGHHQDPESGRSFIPQPACTAPGCAEPVETRQTKSGYSYVGMTLVAGVWCAMPGQKPRCGACRKRDERAAA